MKEIEVIKEHKKIELITSYNTKLLTKYPPITQVTTTVTITRTIIISHTVCLSVGPATETPKLIHYRVVLFHTPDIGLIDL